MKRLIAAGILAVFLLTTYLIGFFSIKNVCDDANSLLKDCINAYNLEKNAEEKAKNLEDFWSEKEKILSFFANHSEIDEIELAIGTLRVYSRTNENEIFSEYCGTVKTLLHQLMEDTVPNIHSIF